MIYRNHGPHLLAGNVSAVIFSKHLAHHNKIKMWGSMCKKCIDSGKGRVGVSPPPPLTPLAGPAPLPCLAPSLPPTPSPGECHLTSSLCTHCAALADCARFSTPKTGRKIQKRNNRPVKNRIMM